MPRNGRNSRSFVTFVLTVEHHTHARHVHLQKHVTRTRVAQHRQAPPRYGWDSAVHKDKDREIPKGRHPAFAHAHKCQHAVKRPRNPLILSVIIVLSVAQLNGLWQLPPYSDSDSVSDWFHDGNLIGYSVCHIHCTCLIYCSWSRSTLHGTSSLRQTLNSSHFAVTVTVTVTF